MSRAVIITEGGRKIGFGHITRCISLHQAFLKKRISTKFIVNGDESVAELLRGREYEIFNWLKKQHNLFDAVKGVDIVIVDSYLAGIRVYEKISELAQTAVYIDDNNQIRYPKGTVVNWTVAVEEIKYPKKNGVTYLLGSKYVSIRKEFWKVPEKRLRKDIKSIMITFGGTDDRNMTPKILRFLNQEYPAFIKKVIIGKGFPRIKEIENLCRKDEKVDLLYQPNANRMKKVMMESDIAISAAGQTLYELARVGLPTIAIDVAGNQLINIKGLESAGFICYTGHWKDKNIFKKIRTFIEELKERSIRKEKYKIGRQLIDGKGSIRIVDYLLKRQKNEANKCRNKDYRG